MSQEQSKNEFAEWFGEDFDKPDVVTTFNLVYDATIMVESGTGYAVTIDKIANTGESSSLCFRPLALRLDSDLSSIFLANCLLFCIIIKLLLKLFYYLLSHYNILEKKFLTPYASKSRLICLK